MSTHKRERACVRCRTRKERLDDVKQLISRISNREWELLAYSSTTTICVQRLTEVLNNAALRVNP